MAKEFHRISCNTAFSNKRNSVRNIQVERNPSKYTSFPFSFFYISITETFIKVKKSTTHKSFSPCYLAMINKSKVLLKLFKR